MDRYRKVRVLGAGSFGLAWLVESNLSGKNYALKELSVLTMSEQNRHLALNEVKILSRLKHKNVVKYKEAFVHESKMYIAMEYAEQGDLFARIKQQNGQYLEEQKILEWFTQLCLALKHIHAQNILHRDLKTQNIFLGKDDAIKLGDFGIARVLDSTTDHAQTAVGTPYYMSPEICQNKPYNHKSDMWALGCVLYELTTLQHPFSADTFSGLVIKILQGEYTPTPSCYGPLLEDLISVLLNRNPEERPSAKQLLHVPAMRPYVGKYVSYDHTRISSDAPEVSMAAESSFKYKSAEGSPKGTSFSARRAAKIKDDIKRSPSEKKGSAADSRLTAVRKTIDRQRGFSEGFVPSAKERETSRASVPARNSSSHEARGSKSHSWRRSEVSKVKESLLKDSLQILSPEALDVEIEVFPLEHPAVSQLRENSDRARKISARCRNNAGIADVSSNRSASVADVLEPKERVVIRRHRSRCNKEGRRNSRNLERDGNQEKAAEKYSVASSNKENSALSVSSQKQRRPPSHAGSPKALRPINLAEEEKSNRSRQASLRDTTYTVICDQCPCTFHTPTKAKKREIKESQSKFREAKCGGHKQQDREKRDELSAKNVDIPSPVKFTFCEETLELDSITNTGSPFARIEALRMFLESRLGTSLLTEAYRYLTKTSSKEKEREVYRVLRELLGTERVAYVPILLRLIACESMMYQ